MKGIVIIPCYNRPGFLQVCLEHIQKAKGYNNYKYYFAVDRANHQLYDVVKTAFDARQIELSIRMPHNYVGNVYNVMCAFREAHIMAEDEHIIHVIEDDVFVAPDYFHFHEKAWQELGYRAFAVSACKNQNHVDDLGVSNWRYWYADNTAEEMIYRHCSYQSIGVSFRKSSMERIVPHAKPEYWTNPVQYIKEAFPDSTLPPGQAEQAGLIHRIVRRESSYTAYPIAPRAYHAGFAGKNRKAKKAPSEYTSDEIRYMTTDEMNKQAVSHSDIVPCEMVYRKIDKIVVI